MLTLFEMLLPLISIILIILPLFFMYKKGVKTINVKQKLIAQISIFAGVFVLVSITQFSGIKAADTAIASDGLATGLGYLGAALATALSALGAGIAVGSAAPAAIGAISENPENFGKAIIFVALGEGIAIYGLLISILIINRL